MVPRSLRKTFLGSNAGETRISRVLSMWSKGLRGEKVGFFELLSSKEKKIATFQREETR